MPLAAPAVRAHAERVLRANWREGERPDPRGGPPVRYAYTCPATPRYRHQWHWDSCFHAIAWRHFDLHRAREELRTVLRGGRRDGFLPHTVFWDRPAGWRRAPLYATSGWFGGQATETIGPPLLPFAWEIVARASEEAGEPGFGAEALGPLAAHLEWLERERDIDGDGLLTILVPDESGLDDSPKYDPVYGRLAHHRIGGYALLVERCRRLGWSARDVAARHDHHVEDVWVNVAYALSLRAMARLSGDMAWRLRAERTESALVERCLDARTGLFLDLAGPDERRVEVSTWSALAPVILPGIPREVRIRLVEEHLLHPERYLATVGIPSVSMQEPSYRPGFDMWRCWRGPSWVNVAWLLLPALHELGYGPEATEIAARLAEAVAREGLREYYDPRTGRGLAARGFAWSALAVDLAEGPGQRVVTASDAAPLRMAGSNGSTSERVV